MTVQYVTTDQHLFFTELIKPFYH